MFLLPHTEAVFFVDDDETEVPEVERLAEQPVRADHDVHLALRETVGDGVHLAVRAQPRYDFEGHRPVGEAVAEGLEVLLGEQGRGGEYRDLAAAGDRQVGGAHRHFGLAETDIAADQPVRGLGAGQVLDHRVDGGVLVGGRLERELLHEAAVVVVRLAEGETHRRLAAGVDVEQLRGGVARSLGRPALGLRPLVRTEPVQRCVFLVGAGVPRHEMQRGDGYVQLRPLGVLEGEELHRMPVDGEGLEAPVAPDAVVDVHHRRSDMEFDQVLDDEIGVDAAPPGPLGNGLVGTVPEDLRLGDDGEIG